MTQWKSESGIVPEGRRKSSKTGKGLQGGKAVPVKEEDQQLSLPFATAGNLHKEGKAEGGRNADQSAKKPRKAPKAKSKRQRSGPARMEEIVKCLEEAFEKVALNKGAPGPDGLSIEQVRKHLATILEQLKSRLLDGSYIPGDIRRVWIPKAGGGERGLGIPDVVDRIVQEATRMVLEPVYEPLFHSSSHGFRPNRSCHTAIQEAKGYVDTGYTWVVDIDLEKFFDKVNHQRLMSQLAKQVKDKRLLVLIGRMLKAKVVLPEGLKVSTEEGVPQGGPISPLLSNVVLSELDEELARRGLKFVRYADDCNIYVKSERAGKRVMESIKRFIEKRLRLRVNESKSAVAQPQTRHFLGFSLSPSSEEGGPVEILLSQRSQKRLWDKIIELTPRNRGASLESILEKINQYLEGWMGYFQICTQGVEKTISSAEAHIRRRLRAIKLKQWKRKRTIAQKLIHLGVKAKTVWRRVYQGRKSLWALSWDIVVHKGLGNSYFVEQGLFSLLPRFRARWAAIPVPKQLSLFWNT